MRRRLVEWSVTWSFLAGIAAIWWFASAGSRSTYYPPLSTIVSVFRHEWLFAHATSDLVPSLYRIGLGLGLSIVVGVSLGLVIGLSPAVRTTVEPALEFIRAIPATAVLPAFIVVLGITNVSKVAFIAFGAVWPILLNTIEGARGIDVEFHDVARVYHLGPVRRLVSVSIPAAIPQIFAGLRIAVSVAVLLVIYAEMFASTNGVGYFTLNAQTLFEIPQMWSGIFVLAILSYVLNGAYAAIEWKVLRWHRGWRSSQADAAA
ncbi:MAG TPA: ABC transporter permease [Acidimicrobiales bacterium]|nr:ABC transporter permease [Acidimicrobiales bacterium]